MTNGVVVGLIANPASARDIRRLVADGAAITTNQKLNVLVRLLSGLAAGGVERVVSMTDRAGLSGGLATVMDRPTGARLPSVEFVDHPITRTAEDTRLAVEAMVARDVSAIVVLGGDGTNRVVARCCGATPLASISTGTNNAFPGTTEPTVVGLATALLATGRVDGEEVTYRAKMLEIHVDGRVENALVDVAVIDADRVGSGAVWDPGSIRELFLAFAEPQAIGLSSIGAHVRPIGRTEPLGLHLELGRPAVHLVTAPLAPGRWANIAVASVELLEPTSAVDIEADGGMIAVDGERLLRLGNGRPASVSLRLDGPVVLDVATTMHAAASQGLLAKCQAPQSMK